MDIISMKLADLTTDPANVRLHSPRNIETIKGSLKRFGQQKPIVVDAQGVCVAGSGTLQAAKELGWESIDVVRTELKDSERIAYAIADNRAGSEAVGSEWDDAALARVLESLKVEDEELARLTGFDDAELKALVDGLQGPTAPPDFKEVDENIEVNSQCPKCGFRWQGKSG